MDVRTAAEVNAAALPDCIHIPLHELTAERLKEEIAKNGKDGKRIFLLCQAGRRAEMAADALKGNLEAELVIIEGGMNAVQQSNIPLASQGRKIISLERQIRIAAGSMVLAGVILGTLVNPGFYYFSGLVGAGLAFAGITDICAMGMLLAKAPWNR